MSSNSSTLTNSLQLAPSELYVADLAKMTAYYRDNIGLNVLETSKQSTILGHGNTDIIKLVSRPQLAHAGPREAGLFHNAVLFDSRGDLARTVGSLITEAPQSFTGTGDHLVSEAFYFNDPEGNGVELYFDRPRDSWQWQNGQIQMDTLYIDPMHYIYANASERTTRDKKLGHIHLKVGDVSEAKNFYVDLLGFDITAQMPSALFVSVAGYHHHIGLNSWMSSGASTRQPTLGLSDITITLGSEDDVTYLASRLEAARHPFTYAQGRVIVSDPWANRLTFTA